MATANGRAREHGIQVVTGKIVTEDDLDSFRLQRLSPEALLQVVDLHVRVLVRLGIGVGKSHAADALLESPALHEQFDFVIYAAPTWSILRERRIMRGAIRPPVPWMQLVPRPKDRCRDFAEPWADLERRGCSTLAKATLCRQCQAVDGVNNRCDWPSQFARIKDHRLLFCTEQQLLLNRALVPMIRGLTGAKRIFVLLDEARLLDANFEISLTQQDLDQFATALRTCQKVAHREQWLHAIEAIRAWRHPADLQLRLHPALHRSAMRIQKAGIDGLGDAFRYAGYDLSLLATSQQSERWIEGDRLRFIARPFLNCHLLLLSANLSADYAGERLGCGTIASPHEGTVFQHTGTRIFNLRSRLGADKYFLGNHRQILDTMAVLIARNIREGRSTVLLSRKKHKLFSAAYITARLAGWGHKVRLVTVDYGSLPARPDPRIIPVIHYGILGVNDYADYDSVYCVCGYYISSKELARAAQESTPNGERVALQIDSKPDQIRRVRVAEGADAGGVAQHVANIYLQKLELDPVIQAAGRVRFMTKPREVVFMQMADLLPHVGQNQVVGSLAELRQRMGIPSAREVDAHIEGTRMRAAIADGKTAAEVATSEGVSVATVRRRLAGLRTLTDTPIYISRESDTPPGPGSEP